MVAPYINDGKPLWERTAPTPVSGRRHAFCPRDACLYGQLQLGAAVG